MARWVGGNWLDWEGGEEQDGVNGDTEHSR